MRSSSRSRAISCSGRTEVATRSVAASRAIRAKERALTIVERARYTQLEDGSYCAEVRGLRGAIATGATLESCRSQLQEVVEEWILVRVARGLDIPVLGGVRIRIRKAG